MNQRFRLAAGMTTSLTVIGIAVVLLINRFAAQGVAEASTASALRVNAATFQVDSISIPTYAYTPALQIRSTGLYTYRWLDWSNYNPSVIIPVTYTLLVVENDYLRVTLLPELGGRVYQMIYKPTGHNELYQNPVIKPTHWGPTEQGWWLAVGGIEWGLPVDEHGYEWGEPWQWNVITSTAGVTVTVRDTVSAERLRAAVDVFLPADRAYLRVGPHLENPTAADVSFKYWTNAMLAPGAPNTVSPDLRFIFNSTEMAVHSTGDDRHFSCAGWTHLAPDCRFPWPYHEGVDFSRLGNWREWLGFFEYPQAAENFVGVYDTVANEGVARVFPADIARGTKGFGMGRPNSGYQIDPNTWTDDGSTYVELHGGVAPAFWDWASLPAGQALNWQEYWYPLSSIGMFSAATAEAALALRPNGDLFNIGVHSTLPRQASVSRLEAWDRVTCALLGRWEFPIDPAHPFSTSLPIDGRTQDDVSIMYVDGAGGVLAAIHPSTCATVDARVQPLPTFVEASAFTVTWLNAKEAVGAGTFQVQVRDGYEGVWTDWLASTQSISATFTGEHGHTYFFRARTLAPNQGALDEEEWGQAFTTVLTQAAPVLVTSRKSGAWATLTILSDTGSVSTEVVSYSLLISNTGNLAAHAAITDVLPAGLEVVTLTLDAESGPPPVYVDGVILWNAIVPPGELVRLSYALVPTTIQRGERFTNTVTLAGSVLGSFTRQAVMTYAWQVWLPIAMR